MKITDTRELPDTSRTLDEAGDLGATSNGLDHPVNTGAVVSVGGLPGLFLLCSENAANPQYSIHGYVRHFLVGLEGGRRLPAAARVLTPVDATLTVQ